MTFSTIKNKIFLLFFVPVAGQGIKTVEQFLTHVFHQAGYYIAATKEYMSRVRGGQTQRSFVSPLSGFVLLLTKLISSFL